MVAPPAPDRAFNGSDLGVELALVGCFGVLDDRIVGERGVVALVGRYLQKKKASGTEYRSSRYLVWDVVSLFDWPRDFIKRGFELPLGNYCYPRLN